jgi:hypothetical protein
LKCTRAHTYDNINLFFEETQKVENRKPNYFYSIIILFLFFIYKQQKSFVFCFSKWVGHLFDAPACIIFQFFLFLRVRIFLFSHKKWSRYVFMELSKNDANLLTREGVFIFISKKLGEIDSEIGNEILVALRRRMYIHQFFLFVHYKLTKKLNNLICTIKGEKM